MNHLAEWTMDDAGDLTRVKCSCGWSLEGEYWVLRSAFDQHVEDHTPQWRDRPNVPGWWLFLKSSPSYPYLHYGTAAWLTQADLDDDKPFDTVRVYGPIPEPEETP